MTSLHERIMFHGMHQVANVLAAGRLEANVTGLHHVPAEGPAIIVARHYHHLFDGVAFYQIMPRRVHILVTLDWATPAVTRRLMKVLLRFARWPVVLRADALERQSNSTFGSQAPPYREKDLNRYQRHAMHDSIRLLSEGRILVVFPEGYPNVDPHFTPKTDADQMLPFKPGFAAIASAAEKRSRSMIPLVPVGMNYTMGAKWRAHLQFGTPRYARSFVSRAALVKTLERDVAELSGVTPPG